MDVDLGLDAIRRVLPTLRNKKQRAFLAAFCTNGNITGAAALAGIHRTSVYVWQEHDPAFSAAFHLADEVATEVLELEAWRRARDGVVKETPIFHNGECVATTVEHKYSDGLLALLLKSRRPEKYKERTEVNVTGPPPVKTLAGEAWEVV